MPQTKTNVQRNGRQSSKSLANEGKRPLGINRKHSLKPLPRNSPASEKAPDRKRKRSHENTNCPTAKVQEEHTTKRARTSVASFKRVASDTCNKTGHPINHWIQEGRWPKEYFEPEINMSSPLARKKSSAALRREALESSSTTPSQKTEGKSAPYKDLAYETLLAEQGSFLDELHQGITDSSKDEILILLNREQEVPQDSLFRNDLFKEACAKLRGRNEARVINDFARLIVPSAETLATYGDTHLKRLTVGINERWNESIRVTPTLPQPDFGVGFQRSAFTPDQLKRLEPFTGNVLAATKSSSFFLATWRMYFPFFTCEAKCGSGGLDIADRQNAHSMTLAVRGIVELFKLVKREKELHRKVLAFSISHDDETVRIFGHYSVIDGDKTTFYRHPIHKFDFTAVDGKDKWTAYKFTKNVYDIWMPDHYKLICSAIDDIPPDINFEVPLGGSFTSNASADESELLNSQDMATSAPASQESGFVVPPLPSAKKAKLMPQAMLEQEIERLREQNKQEREQSNQQLTELMKQMAQEKEERAQKEEQSNQRHRELMDLLKGQMDRQKEQMDPQIEELNRTA
ncbi:hypothetical protein MMC17_009532 [Xylographa soralifera]|nr:hypothetical protein [Xylographa soralifera]